MTARRGCVAAKTGKAEYNLFAGIPNVLFLVLDVYYLSLERRFRKSYNGFIQKLHSGVVEAKDLYVITPSGSASKEFFAALGSFSIWPFYGTLAVMIWLAGWFIGGAR